MSNRHGDDGCDSRATGTSQRGVGLDSSWREPGQAGSGCAAADDGNIAGVVDEDSRTDTRSAPGVSGVVHVAANWVPDDAGEVVAAIDALGADWGDDDEDPLDDEDDDDDEDDEDDEDLDDDDFDD